MNVGPRPALDRLADNSAEFRNGPVPDPALAYYYRLGQTNVVLRSPAGTRPAMGPVSSPVAAPASTGTMRSRSTPSPRSP